MQRLWRFLYSYGIIPCVWMLVQIVGLLKRKVRRGIVGRRNLMEHLSAQMRRIGAGKRVWFHASSLGEFEQAKPIIAELKHRYPDVRIITTFFSPSGYEHSRKYPLADVISYLPFDSLSNARRFVECVRPDVAVMVRYDIWPNHIWEMEQHEIPVMIANATMRSTTQRRILLSKNFHHHVYNAIGAILTVSEGDARAFSTFKLTRPVVRAIGDTRYDQVSLRSAEARKRHIVPSRILEGQKVIVAGSTWPEDDQVVIPAFLRILEEAARTLLILVPHEPTIDHLEEVEAELDGKTKHIRFSALNEYTDERVIIVDSIGILLTLYSHAHIAYVGGSFRQGIHNVLEAAVFGIPVIFGPKHRNSEEPLRLVEHGGGFVVNDTAELLRTLRNLLEDERARSTAGERAATFVRSNIGATAHFLEHLEPYLSNGAQHMTGRRR